MAFPLLPTSLMESRYALEVTLKHVIVSSSSVFSFGKASLRWSFEHFLYLTMVLSNDYVVPFFLSAPRVLSCRTFSIFLRRSEKVQCSWLDEGAVDDVHLIVGLGSLSLALGRDILSTSPTTQSLR